MANIIQNHIKGFLSSLVTQVMLEVLLLNTLKCQGTYFYVVEILTGRET